jgi:type III pantothenate kinase
MLLAINVGNTNVSAALFDGPDRVASWRVRSDREQTADGYGTMLERILHKRGFAPSGLTGAALASVVPPLTPILSEACRDYLGQDPLVADLGQETGLHIQYEAGQLGIDRLLDAVAARALYGLPVCVIDFGTATTFNAVDADANFLGGAIAPGVGIAARALFERTSALHSVELTSPPEVIGRNVRHSIQSGVVFGYAGLVEGMIARYRAELGSNMHVIATGGLSGLVASETPAIDVVNPWLTLHGLRIIYELNT